MKNKKKIKGGHPYIKLKPLKEESRQSRQSRYSEDDSSSTGLSNEELNFLNNILERDREEIENSKRKIKRYGKDTKTLEQIVELEDNIAAKEEIIKKNNEYIKLLKEELEKKETIIQTKDENIKEQIKELENKDTIIQTKDETIEKLKNNIETIGKLYEKYSINDANIKSQDLNYTTTNEGIYHDEINLLKQYYIKLMKENDMINIKRFLKYMCLNNSNKEKEYVKGYYIILYYYDEHNDKDDKIDEEKINTNLVVYKIINIENNIIYCLGYNNILYKIENDSSFIYGIVNFSDTYEIINKIFNILLALRVINFDETYEIQDKEYDKIAKILGGKNNKKNKNCEYLIFKTKNGKKIKRKIYIIKNKKVVRNKKNIKPNYISPKTYIKLYKND